MSDAGRWLRDHTAAAPPALREAMLAALDPAPGAAVPDALAGAALALYRRVASGAGGRADALPLLAADALFTHAFQAQAELDPAGIPALARRWGGSGRLAEVLR